MNQMLSERRDTTRKLVVLLARINRKKVNELPRARRKEMFSGEDRYCPLCKSHLKEFLVFGVVSVRPNAWCPICGSLERHRLAWTFLQRKTDLFEDHYRSLLHIAPEPMLEANFKKVASLDYLSADLDKPRAMVKMDITDIDYPKGSFDAVFCSHVLEHVSDDRRAMQEFKRVLKAGGWALIMVPITSDRTFEDPSITSPQERQRLFGQHNHVRRYGAGFRERLEEAGFRVSVFHASELLDTQEMLHLGLSKVRREESLFFCEKEPSSTLLEDQNSANQQSGLQLHNGERSIKELKAHIEKLENDHLRLSTQMHQLQAQLQEIHDSNTWKLVRNVNSARSGALNRMAALTRKIKSSVKR